MDWAVDRCPRNILNNIPGIFAEYFNMNWEESMNIHKLFQNASF